jgi:hypothetical protein
LTTRSPLESGAQAVLLTACVRRAASDWRLTRPADVPGQSIDQADYVLIAEIVEVERWEQQASELVQRLADDLADLVSNRGLLVLRPAL